MTNSQNSYLSCSYVEHRAMYEVSGVFDYVRAQVLFQKCALGDLDRDRVFTTLTFDDDICLVFVAPGYLRKRKMFC